MYKGQSDPILASEGEERRLLRHLNKITRRGDRTVEEDEIIRRGYYKVIHRVLNSLTTMDRRDEMDRVHLKRAVLYISTRLVEYWNCGVPIIKSYHRDGDIKLISSQGNFCSFSERYRELTFLSLVLFAAVFQDIWTSIRSHRYNKEKRESLLANAELAEGGMVDPPSAVRNTERTTIKSTNKPVRRVGMASIRYYRSGVSPSTSASASSTPSSQSSCSPSNQSFNTTSSQGGYMAMGHGHSSPGLGHTMSTARRYITRSAVSSTTSSPYANSPESFYDSSPVVQARRAPRKNLYAARRLDTSLVNEDSNSDSESDSVESDSEEEKEAEEKELEVVIKEDSTAESDQDQASEQEYFANDDSMKLDEAVETQPKSDDKAHFDADEEQGPMTPHQVRWDWATRGMESTSSKDSTAEEEADTKMDAIFKKHIGENFRKLRRGDLECITTPESVAGRMAYSGSSLSSGWNDEDGDIAVESDAEYESAGAAVRSADTKPQTGAQGGIPTAASDSESDSANEEDAKLFGTATASVVLEAVKEVVRNSPTIAGANDISASASASAASYVSGDSPHSVGSTSTPSRKSHLRWSMPLSNEATPSSIRRNAATTPNCTVSTICIVPCMAYF